MALSGEYNPLDYGNLTKNCVQELMGRGPYPLPPATSFEKAGVYALFYTGNAEAYAPFRSPDASRPIYVGKAVPAGARKGRKADAPNSRKRKKASPPDTPLFGRLREHAASIRAVENLALDDFLCRYLVVTPLWITMSERFLIEHYRPLWNVWLDGFGNHDPGKNRSTEISWWDALHPGRTSNWKAAIQVTKTREEAEERVRAFLDLPAQDLEQLALEAMEAEDGDEGGTV
jgi:hypothetical protein